MSRTLDAEVRDILVAASVAEIRDYLATVEEHGARAVDERRLRNAVLALRDARVERDVTGRQAHARAIVGAFARKKVASTCS